MCGVTDVTSDIRVVSSVDCLGLLAVLHIIIESNKDIVSIIGDYLCRYSVASQARLAATASRLIVQPTLTVASHPLSS